MLPINPKISNLLIRSFFLLISSSLIISFLPTGADAYDPMDLNGNITIKWDILRKNDNNYDARVTIYNYQLYRHVEWPPGWSLSWEWQTGEVINYITGAEAKEQGVCNITGTHRHDLPHCCLKRPVIIDLPPGTPFNRQVNNCCRNGVLASTIQDPSKSTASFQMNVGHLNSVKNNILLTRPCGFRFGSEQGYSCGHPEYVHPPTKFMEDSGRRRTQALETWRVTCGFSQFQASPTPRCCVSLSAFYNPTIIPCQTCSCACQSHPSSKCLRMGEEAPMLKKPSDPDEVPPTLVRCTSHMCPVRVHWHVKESYRDYWRLKITVTNLNVYRNYSRWNVAVDHPNLDGVVEVFSFNYKPLYNDIRWNQTGLFWGVQHYNDMLLEEGGMGNVQTELILRKKPGKFTFRGGWAFPRRIYFDGHECVMPPPDRFPRLPNEKGSR